MLFSRKNAAIVAAFLAPSAYAQSAGTVAQNPASCNSTTLATLNIYAPAATVGGTTNGPLALQVVADLTQPCTNNLNVAGFLITSVTGTYAGASGGPVTFLPGTANGGDQCLVPCASNVGTNGILDSAGLTFARTESGANVAYRYQYTSANGFVLQPASQTAPQTTSLVGAGLSFQTCKFPSNGAGVCAMQSTCSSTGVDFETFSATDNAGNRLTVNIAFNPNAPCAQTPAAAGTTNPQGLAINGISGSYLGQIIIPNGQNGPYCFYPCSAGTLDPTGFTFFLRDSTTYTAGTTTYSLTYTTTTANGVSTSSYKLSGAALTGSAVSQSCNAGQPAFYASCPVSSSSTTMSSTSSSAISVSVPVSTPSISVPVTLPTSGINTGVTSVLPSSSIVNTGSVSVTIPTSSVVIAPTSTNAVSIPTSTPTVSIATSSPSAPSSSVIVSVSGISSTGGSTTVTGTAASSSTTATRVSTTSASVATGPQTSVPTPFVITINISVRKRQAVQYVGAGGALTTDPTQAAVFNLVNGQLFSNGAIVSTGPAIPAQQPFAGGAQGTVTTLWTSTNNAIAWTNGVFANGAATFCVANNIVNTVFVNAPANGCVPVALTQVAQSAVVAAVPSQSAAGGITIINNNNPVIGVYVTVNLTFGTTTLGNGSVITTTGLATTTSPLYANPSGSAYCVSCAMSAIGASCPSSGVTVYTTACGCATASPAVAVTCPTCAPVTLPAATATAGAYAAGAAAAAAAAAAAGTGAGSSAAAAAAAAAGAAGAGATAAAAAAATAGKTTYTGAASSFGVEAAALMAAGVALLL